LRLQTKRKRPPVLELARSNTPVVGAFREPRNHQDWEIVAHIVGVTDEGEGRGKGP